MDSSVFQETYTVRTGQHAQLNIDMTVCLLPVVASNQAYCLPSFLPFNGGIHSTDLAASSQGVMAVGKLMALGMQCPMRHVLKVSKLAHKAHNTATMAVGMCERPRYSLLVHSPRVHTASQAKRLLCQGCQEHPRRPW